MRLIDADALKLDIMCVYGSNPKYINWLNHAPTVDAEPVKHGVWFGTVCSCCGASTSDSYDCEYCPHCGAKMVEYPESGEGDRL